MADNPMPEFNRPKVITLVLHATLDGQIEIEGPTSNLILCYGILELAKAALTKHHTRQDVILKADLLDLPKGS